MALLAQTGIASRRGGERIEKKICRNCKIEMDFNTGRIEMAEAPMGVDIVAYMCPKCAFAIVEER